MSSRPTTPKLINAISTASTPSTTMIATKSAGSSPVQVEDCRPYKFRWTVEGDLFDRFLKAQTGEFFDSSQFQFCGGLWTLKAYPNGTVKYGEGNVSLFLAVSKLPPLTVELGIQYEFECNEVNYKDEYGTEPELINIFNKKHSSWGYPETFKHSLLLQLSQRQKCRKIVIQCVMKKVLSVAAVPVLLSSSKSSSSVSPKHANGDGSTSSICSSDGEAVSSSSMPSISVNGGSSNERMNPCSHVVTWYIDAALKRKFKDASKKQKFQSTEFTMNRSKWCIECYPMGDRYASVGMVSLCLKLLEFPERGAYHIKSMKFRLMFECVEFKWQSQIVLHTFENKQQSEVFYGLSDAFAASYLKYLPEEQTLCVKCKIDLLAVAVDGEKWWHCIRERDALKSKVKRLEQEAREVEKKRKSQTAYHCNRVVVMKEATGKMRDKVKRANDETQSILKHHRKILKQWDETTEQLKKVVVDNQCNIHVLQQQQPQTKHTHASTAAAAASTPLLANGNTSNGGGGGGDESESESDDMESTGYQLLDEHIQCIKITDLQNDRMDSVLSNAKVLCQQQSQLTRSLHEWKANISASEQVLSECTQQYNAIKEERCVLQQLIREKVAQCNGKIDSENECNKKKHHKENELKAMSAEIKTFQAMSERCKRLIERYHTFRSTNSDYIELIQQHVSKKWNEFERNWIYWNARDIMAFIKYKKDWYNELSTPACVDLVKIERAMAKAGMNGRVLRTLDKSQLLLVGFEDIRLRSTVFECIRVLRSKYPAPKHLLLVRDGSGSREEIDIHSKLSKHHSSNSNNMHDTSALNGGGDGTDMKCEESEPGAVSPSSRHPPQFMCSLTNKLMTDPVMAFDGHCYERSAITAYLKEHKQSPHTGETAHTELLFPCKVLRQEIETYRSVNDLEDDLHIVD